MGDRRLIVVSILTFIALFMASSADAKVVHCGPGDIRCLIAAINVANGSGQPTRVTLAAATYTLSVQNLLPAVSGRLTILGVGPRATILDAAAANPTLNSIVTVEATGTLALQNLAIRGGIAPAAVINNRGAVSLLNTEIRDNSGLSGGGVRNTGTMTIANSEIRNNDTFLGAGGVFNTGTLTIVRSTIEGNDSGEGTGGIANQGVLRISESTISANTGNEFTGGVSSDGELTITDSILSNNVGGTVGALRAGNIATISRTAIIGNRGRGSIFDVTLGTAVLAGDTARFENTTIVGNVSTPAFQVGENFRGFAVVGGTLVNSTVADNVANVSQVQGATLQNTIVDRTGAMAGVGPDCDAEITSLGNNIIGDPSGCAAALLTSDRTGNAGLASGLNVFVSGSVPLLGTSQAIDTANNDVCPALDQNHLPRVDGDNDGVVQCDIGAVEFVHHVVDIRAQPHVFSTGAARVVTIDVFGNSEFDPETIDLTTTKAGATGYEALSGRRLRFADVDGDGLLDLQLHFTASSLALTCDSPFVAFTAKTASGESVAGVSEVVLRDCRR